MRQRALLSYSALVAAFLCAAPAAQAQRRGPLLIRGGNKCLDLNGPQVQTNGGRVQIWDCNGGPNQLWRYERGRLVSVASGRCLDVHGPDVGQNGGHVQTWDCHGGPNQQWGIEPAGGPPPPPPPPVVVAPPPPAPAGRDVEAGPIWNNGDAGQKCPRVCAPASWTGQWRTTVPGRMSVCSCSLQGPPMVVPPPPPGPQVRPMNEERFNGLLQAMGAEAFSQGKTRVIEEAARSHYFLVAQLRRVVESLTFSADKIRAVELIAPRLLDRQNAYTLYSVFTFEGDKEQARRILERN